MIKLYSIVFCLLFLSQQVFASSEVNTLIEQGKYDEAIKVAVNQEQNHYLATLVKKAQALNLANHAVWLTLGHYKKNIFSQHLSQVDSQDFFLAHDGKSNPEKELEATLAAFFSTKKLEPNKLSIQCRFVARFYWLNQQLNFSQQYLKKEACNDFNMFLEILAPEKLTVVFPSTHPNSPSSMFGHTLLRIDKIGQTDQTKMLNYSINYAALIDPNVSPFSYSILGLSGGFPGKFSIVPYYTKLREYAQMENRDVWEYTLNIPQKQIEFILMHTYELAPSYFDYYFFTENCSYHLLSLLDVSFPENRLTDHFKSWTIPIETIRLLRKKNLISEVKYNPSHARTIQAKQKQMSAADIALTAKTFNEGLADNKHAIKSLSEDKQIQILDLLNDYHRYKKLKNSEHSATKLNKQERQVLLMRSKIKKTSKSLIIEAPSIQPDLGHSSSKIAIGAMQKTGTREALSLRWRPAYHDLLDPSAGFVTNASLEFFNLNLNYDIEKSNLKVENFTALEIISLEPRDDFFSDISWRLLTGWKNQSELDLKNVSYLEGGAGLSYSLTDSKHSIAYSFLSGSLEYSNDFKKNWRIAPELRLGIVSEFVSRWRIHAYVKSLKGMFTDNSQVNVFVMQQSLAISKNLSLRISAQQGYKEKLRWNEFSAELHYYY